MILRVPHPCLPKGGLLRSSVTHSLLSSLGFLFLCVPLGTLRLCVIFTSRSFYLRPHDPQRPHHPPANQKPYHTPAPPRYSTLQVQFGVRRLAACLLLLLHSYTFSLLYFFKFLPEPHPCPAPTSGAIPRSVSPWISVNQIKGRELHRHRTAATRLFAAIFLRTAAPKTKRNAAIANPAFREPASKTGVAYRANSIAPPTLTIAPANAPTTISKRAAPAIFPTSHGNSTINTNPQPPLRACTLSPLYSSTSALFSRLPLRTLRLCLKFSFLPLPPKL